ncbi:MAG: hypothetical protein HQL08_09605 [Nitrospirae bacterium]|nr:hypothetical protein [Nitrospirota bacterium]
MKVFPILIVLLCSILLAAGCEKAERISLWDRHCASCHDGKTVLNGKVVVSREQIRGKYKTLDEFSNACSGSASGTCMNILKHDKKLFMEVGREIGVGRTNAAMLPSNGPQCTP